MTLRSILVLSFVLVLGVAGCAPTSAPKPGVDPVDDPATDVTAEELTIKPTPLSRDSGQRILAAIHNVRDRDLLTTNGFWTVFHGILGMGFSTTLRDARTGQKVNAIDYIADGGEMRGLQFIQTKHGLDVQIGPIMVGQGHQDQFVAEMAQWNMPADRKFVVFGRDYTFMDFVRHSQMRARVTAEQELGWAILVIGQYLGTDISWTNAYGEKLKYKDLLRYEVDMNLDGAACGGTHSLFGLTWALHLHLRAGGKTEGIWKEVADKIAKHKALARDYQHEDGSFSTDFFRGRGNADDKTLRINTTGHTLEWLALALSDTEIKKPWVQSAANALSLMILDLQDAPIEGGSLYHAVHGLILYYSRAYGNEDLGPLKPFMVLPPK
jgi:hypothetical protein